MGVGVFFVEGFAMFVSQSRVVKVRQPAVFQYFRSEEQGWECSISISFTFLFTPLIAYVLGNMEECNSQHRRGGLYVHCISSSTRGGASPGRFAFLAGCRSVIRSGRSRRQPGGRDPQGPSKFCKASW